MKRRLITLIGCVAALLMVAAMPAGASIDPDWIKIETPRDDGAAWTACLVLRGTPYRLFLPPHDSNSSGDPLDVSEMRMFKDKGCLKKKQKLR